MAAGNKTNQETELKIPCKDLDVVRNALRENNAREGFAGIERNVVFDTADRRLFASDGLLRLRQYDKCTLTFKGPRGETSPVKTRSEFEAEVVDFARMEQVLYGLGYGRVWVYEKFREEWFVGDATVTLDRLPCIGCFVEVEAADEDAVLAVARRLGLDISGATSKTYAELFEEYLAERGEEFRDLVFEEKESQ